MKTIKTILAVIGLLSSLFMWALCLIAGDDDGR